MRQTGSFGVHYRQCNRFGQVAIEQEAATGGSPA